MVSSILWSVQYYGQSSKLLMISLLLATDFSLQATNLTQLHPKIDSGPTFLFYTMAGRSEIKLGQCE